MEVALGFAATLAAGFFILFCWSNSKYTTLQDKYEFKCGECEANEDEANSLRNRLRLVNNKNRAAIELLAGPTATAEVTPREPA